MTEDSPGEMTFSGPRGQGPTLCCTTCGESDSFNVIADGEGVLITCNTCGDGQLMEYEDE